MCKELCAAGLSELVRKKFPPIILTKEEKDSLPGKRCNKKKADRNPSEDADHIIWYRHYEDLRKSKGQDLRNSYYQKIYQERYRVNHPDKLSDYYQKIYEENYEYFADGARKRRAMEANVYSEPYRVENILKRWGTACHLCGEEIDLSVPRHAKGGSDWPTGLQLDHLIPISQGGPDIIENVKPSHAVCNLKRSKSLVDLDNLPFEVDDKVLSFVSKDVMFVPKKKGRKRLSR